MMALLLVLVLRNNLRLTWLDWKTACSFGDVVEAMDEDWKHVKVRVPNYLHLMEEGKKPWNLLGLDLWFLVQISF